MFVASITRSFAFNAKNKRISRGQYILSISLVVCICFALLTVFDIYGLQKLAFIPAMICAIAAIFLGIKRLNDLEEPRRQIIFLIIPILNIYIQYVFWFKKGTIGPNKFGQDPLQYQSTHNSVYRLIGILLTGIYVYLSQFLKS